MKQRSMEVRRTSADPVSSEMTAVLNLMIRRVRRLIILRGLSLVILAALAGLALAMTIDGYRVIYSTWARWGLALLMYGPAAAMAGWSLVRPLSQTLTPAGLARVIERRHPELHERISSAVELMAGIDTPHSHGSASLIRALGEAASADIRQVNPRVEISMRKVARYLTGCAMAVLAVATVILAWPSTAGRLALRSALPMLNLPNIHAGDLTVEPGDTVILQGDRLRIGLTSTRANLPDARLILEHTDGRRETLTMKRIPGGDPRQTRFSIMTEPLDADTRYRIRGGDAVTRAYQVTVTAPPEVEYLDIGYHYPAYTERESRRSRVIQGDIRAVTGTEVDVRARFNKPVRHVTLWIDGHAVAQTTLAQPQPQPTRGTRRQARDRDTDPETDAMTDPDTGTPDDPEREHDHPVIDPQTLRLRRLDDDVAEFRLQLEPDMQTVWKIEATDEHGFTGGTREFMLYAVTDTVPDVRIIQPTDDQLRLRATDRLKLDYTITDDFGIELAGLILEADGRPLPIRRLPLAGTAAANRELQGEISLDLGELPLEEVRQLALQLRARDCRDQAFGGPQVGKSRILTIALDATARPHREQVLEQHTERLRQALHEAREAITQTRQPITRLDNILQQPQPDRRSLHETTRETLAAMEAIDHELEKTADLMRDGFYDGLRQPLTEDAGAEVIHAAETVSQIPVSDTREEQTAMTAEAAAALDRADAALETMTGQLETMHQTLEHALATRELAERQADMAAAMAPEHRVTQPPESTPDTALADALIPERETQPEDPEDATAVSTAQDPLDRLQKQQQTLVDELAALIENIPEAGRLATETMRDDIAKLDEAIERIQAQHDESRARTAESQQQAEAWEDAAETLQSQFEALSEAHREVLLPQSTVSPAEIADDLDAGRLQQAAEKIDAMAAELTQQRETLEREQRTAELADEVRELMEQHAVPLRRPADPTRTAHHAPDADHIEDPRDDPRDEPDGEPDDDPAGEPVGDPDGEPDGDGYAHPAELAERFDELAEAARDATPLAQQAFALYNPAADLRAAAPSRDDQPADADARDNATGQPEDAADRARDKAARLEASLDAAAKSARAERLAEKFDAVVRDIEAMESLQTRSHDLAQRMAQAIDPWQESLDAAETRAAEQAAATQRRREALADDAQALLDAMRDHPVAAPAVTEPLQQALQPPPEPSPDEPVTPPSAHDAQRAAQAAEETRQAADTVETAAAQTRERADAMTRRAREALDDLADVADDDLQREARWRMEDAEEARERDHRRAEDAQAMAGRLERLADSLDEIAADIEAAETQRAAIASDRERIEEARALADDADRRAEAAERALERLREKQADLEAQQEAMLAEFDAIPDSDARTAAREKKESSIPAAAEALQTLSQTAADLAQRQTELADAAAESQAARDALRPRPDGERDTADPGAEPADPVTAEAEAPDAETERETIEKLDAIETGLRELADTQRDMARKTRDIKRQAAEWTADTRPIPLPQPEQAMDRAARALEAGDPQRAHDAARQAAEDQARLAETLAERATAMPPDERWAAALPAGPMDAAEPATDDPATDEQRAETPTAGPDTETAALPSTDDPRGIPVPPSQQAAFDRESTAPDDTGSTPPPESGAAPSTETATRQPPTPPPLPAETGEQIPIRGLTEHDLEAAKRELAELQPIPLEAPAGPPDAMDPMDLAMAAPSPSPATPETAPTDDAPDRETAAGEAATQPAEPSVAAQETSGQAPAHQPAATPSDGEGSPTAMTPEQAETQQPEPPTPPMDGAPSPATPRELAHQPDTQPTGMGEPADMPSGTPPAGLQPGAEAERLRRLEERLDPQSRVATSLPAHSGWRDMQENDTVAPETIDRLFDQMQQLDALAPRFLPDTPLPDAIPRRAADQQEPPDIDHLLPALATHARAYREIFEGRDPETLTAEAAAEHRALAEALHYAGRAALSGDPRLAEEAARRMALTADAAQRRAEAMGLSATPRISDPDQDKQASEDAMRRLGLPVSDWLRLPGELRSDVLQARPSEGPQEYRDLIRRYFSDLARQPDTEESP